MQKSSAKILFYFENPKRIGKISTKKLHLNSLYPYSTQALGYFLLYSKLQFEYGYTMLSPFLPSSYPTLYLVYV
jgi:hypothetical protein